MWRIFALGLLCSCNALFGVHELPADAQVDSSIDADPCVSVCECHVDADCAGSGAHYVCVNAVTSRTCECAAGYTAGTGGACAWTGVVTNPGFTSSMAWTTVGGAGIDTTGSGSVDPGYAVLDDASCTYDVGVTQTVTMPRLASAEPLVIKATYESTNNEDFSTIVPTLGTVSDDEFNGTLGNWQTYSSCLGAGQYAPASSTGLGAMMPLSVYASCDAMYLDHVDVVPAPANLCPTPGTVFNGDCSATGGGWTLSAPGSGTDATKAVYVSTGGYQNGPGIDMFITGPCDTASASTTMAPPLLDSTGSPVLSFYHSTAQSYLQVTIDGLPVKLSGPGAMLEQYCVPGYMRGGVYSVAAQVNTGGGVCANVVDDDAVIGSFSMANQPACGSDAYFADPGFESGLSLVGTSQAYSAGISVIADSTGHATPTPAHHLQLQVASICGGANLDDPVVVPPAAGSAGPAVTFWYNYGAGTNTAMTVPSYMVAFTPTRDGMWHQGVACLDPNRAGRLAAFNIGLTATGGGSCGSGFTTETLLIDDLSATTSATCPAQ